MTIYFIQFFWGEKLIFKIITINHKMTFKSEFKDIFEKAHLDETYFRILKWLSKYRKIVKHQPSITHIMKRIYVADLNQESQETVTVMRNPIITQSLQEFIEDFLFGQVYQSIRDEMLD